MVLTCVFYLAPTTPTLRCSSKFHLGVTCYRGKNSLLFIYINIMSSAGQTPFRSSLFAATTQDTVKTCQSRVLLCRPLFNAWCPSPASVFRLTSSVHLDPASLLR